MAIIDTNLDVGSTREEVRIERVKSRGRRKVLALLLTGEVDPSDDTVDGFLKFIRQQRLRLDLLYAAYDNGRPQAVAMVLPSAGRTGVVLCSPVPGEEAVLVTSQVIRHAIEQQGREEARLIQSLTDPPQHLERRALGEAGFEDLATLVYMEREVGTGLEPPSMEGAFEHGLRTSGRLNDDMSAPKLTTLHWGPRHRQAFEQAVLESYHNTLDCPGLLGQRTIQEVMAGHMSTGKFDPKLWWAFFEGDNPVAVLLLAPVAQRQAHELVYLGVSEPYRGMGLGATLVRLALHAVSTRGGGRIFLAVDQQNRPAVKLYRHFQFRINAHKRAMILPGG